MTTEATPITELTPEMVAGPWTRFMDMHSGGHQNTEFGYIYIQAPEDEAVAVFGARFDQNPHSVNCSCCGSNYSVSDYESLLDATNYDRNDYPNAWGKRVELLDFVNTRGDICFIFATDIKEGERDESNIPGGYYASDDWDDEDDEDDE